MSQIRLIAIGCSSGGVEAIQKVLTALPKSFDTPIAIVLHISPDSKTDLNLVYGHCTSCKIVEIEDKMKIEKGRIYFAPPNYHILVEPDFTFSLSNEEPVNYSRPSIDVLFESCARFVGNRVCGVLLTGSNEDGAEGLKDIHEMKGITLVQDPKSAASPTMPQSAIQIFQPNFILNLDQISKTLVKISEVSL